MSAIARLLDAAYDLDAPDRQAWLDGLAQACAGLARGRLATSVVHYQLKTDGWEIGEIGGMPEPMAADVREHANATSPEFKRYWIRQRAKHGTFFKTISAFDKRTAQWWWDRKWPVPTTDMLYTQCLDGGDEMLLLCRLTMGASKSTTALRRLSRVVAAHVVAGHRLRRSLRGTKPCPALGEVVLDPAGRVVHAQGPGQRSSAREALRARVRARERQRDGKRVQLDAWTALVEGRWTLVDFFDTDGKRFHVALRNDPSFEPVDPLSEREREVARMAAQGLSNDAIGYALGLPASTVGSAIGRALTKLRLRRRTDLPWLVESAARTLTADPGAEGSVHLVVTPWRKEVLARLTDAEQEVARGVVAGLTDVEIAAERGVSARTIANQLRSIARKLEVSDRVQIVRALVERIPVDT